MSTCRREGDELLGRKLVKDLEEDLRNREVSRRIGRLIAWIVAQTSLGRAKMPRETCSVSAITSF